jgi:hypothetical protein
MQEGSALMGKLREWLTANKVFFETVAAVALTGMSLVVSFGSLKVSEKQLDVANQQLLMSRADVEPIFHLDEYDHPDWSWYTPGPQDEASQFLPIYANLWNEGAPIQLRRYQALESATILRLYGEGNTMKWIHLRDDLWSKNSKPDSSSANSTSIANGSGLLIEFRRQRSFKDGFDELWARLNSACESGLSDACAAKKGVAVETIAVIHFFKGKSSPDNYYFSVLSDTNMPPVQEDLARLFESIHDSGTPYTIGALSKMDARAILKIAMSVRDL